jgi:hypothetical protein
MSSIVKFQLTSSEYTELFIKVKNREADERFFDLFRKLLNDHSSILKEIILYPNIEIVWDETNGKEK